MNEGLWILEKNILEKQLKENTAAVIAEIREELTLELDGIRSMVSNLDEQNQQRFQRRLDRIDRILSNL